jgi:lipoprotein-releasing system ATP-binding protein
MSQQRGMQIRAEGLSKFFNTGVHRIDVLKALDLEIGAGERISVVGHSGSGKSTFLHVLGTLDKPSTGRLWFNGEDAFARPAREIDALRNREIGFVFQFHHLLGDHTALRNVMIPALIAGVEMRKAEADAEEILCRVGLKDRLTHRPGKLSGGEQQRVAIARAMVRRPSLLLADEPTGNLDSATAESVLEMMLDLNEEIGCTLVVVTHSLVLADRLERKLQLTDGIFVETTGGTQ